MIKLENVNKYFYKNKKNQIHVINNASVQLDNKGIVALLGPSGCGKTTLLNAISGLDKVNSGKIYVNGKKISKRISSKVDEIRNVNIGYIFQDYNLIDTLSVFDNVALSLKLIGIKDKEEITKRVNYVLEKVNMYRYKNRYASMLSGGERQRVAIARAIVKNPNIIIADEPTGNLDSANTIEVMNIIKAISKDKLVVLVTHEKELANFYASRILEIEDGKIINDIENNNVNDLDYKIGNNIYLKDFKYQNSIKMDNININYYSDIEEKIKFDIIVKNGNIYINGNDDIEILKSDSKIKVINDNYKKITKKDYESYDFNFNEFRNVKPRYSSIFNIFTLLKRGFAKIRDYTFAKKLLLIGFFVSALFITYSISSIFGIKNVDESKFVTLNRNYVQIQLKSIAVKDYLNIENNRNVNYMLPSNSLVSLIISNKEYYQTYFFQESLEGSLVSAELIGQKDIKYGRMIQNNKEIIIDEKVYNDIIENSQLPVAGYNKIETLLDKTVKVGEFQEYKIVGIVSLNSKSIYAYDSEFTNMIANSNSDYLYDKYAIEDANSESNVTIYDYELFKDKIVLKKGRYPINDYEVIVNVNYKDTIKLNTKIITKINKTKLKVVGYYYSIDNYDYYLVNNNMIKYKNIENSNMLTIYSTNKTDLINEYKNSYDIKDSYKFSKENYVKERNEALKGTLIFSLVILIISLVEIYLMVRSSFLSRIKEVGIYRAIGVKKIDIYKMFSGEIIAITTIAGLPAIVLMSYSIYQLSFISLISDKFMINWFVIVVVILFVYAFNLLVGLLPVSLAIKKTPAQILSRSDI